MPLPILPIPAFPSVPILPGVPLLARASGVATQVSRVVLFTADAINLIKSFLPTTWGLYSEEGVPLLIGDNMAAVDFKRDARLADYPIERGGFSSYNKVQTPYDARATFTVGGSDARRALFLTTLDKLVKSLTLVSLVTPEVTYASANVIHYDYRRTSKNGASLLTVEVWIMEVRLTAGAAFTDAAAPADAGVVSDPALPSGASPASAGTVQAAPLAPVQAAAVPPRETVNFLNGAG